MARLRERQKSTTQDLLDAQEAGFEVLEREGLPQDGGILYASDVIEPVTEMLKNGIHGDIVLAFLEGMNGHHTRGGGTKENAQGNAGRHRSRYW